MKNYKNMRVNVKRNIIKTSYYYPDDNIVMETYDESELDRTRAPVIISRSHEGDKVEKFTVNKQLLRKFLIENGILCSANDFDK